MKATNAKGAGQMYRKGEGEDKVKVRGKGGKAER